MKTKIINLSDASFEGEVLEADMPVLVDFWAEWCGPCKMMAPVLEEIAEEYNGSIKVCKLDVDAFGDMAARYGIMSIPTLIIFRNGKEMERLIGFHSKAQLAKAIDKNSA